MQKSHNEVGAVELLLLALLALAWAAWTLARLVLVPLLGLLLVLAGLDRPQRDRPCASAQGCRKPAHRPRRPEPSRAPGDAAATALATALEHSTPAKLTERLDPDQKGVSRVHTPGGRQTLTFVTESGFPPVHNLGQLAKVRPAHHPLAALRDELALLTVRELKQMAGAATRKNARKQEVINALLFCG
jgi:hypothetical protein